MELGALISEPFLASAKGAEVLYRFRADVIVEDEVDSAFLFCGGKSAQQFSICLCWLAEMERER